MTKKVLLPLALVILFIAACIIFFLAGDIHSVQSMTIKRVQPTELANAMKADNFFSTYRRNTLVVKGEVSQVKKVGSSERLTFKTNSSYSTECNLTASSTVPSLNSFVTVLSEGGRAIREPHGVLLVDCVIP